MILDNQLRPVWFRPVPKNVVASNLSLQRYQGEPVLAWWQGVVTSTGATESGEIVVVDRHYRTVATLTGKDGWILTLHDFEIRGDEAWVTANRNVPMNLTQVRRRQQRRARRLRRAGVQLDRRQAAEELGRARPHSPADSHATPPTNGFPWDAYHVNSIDLEPGGKLLVSMRNTWAAYQVDLATGTSCGRSAASNRASSSARTPTSNGSTTSRSGPSIEVALFDDHCCEVTGAGTYLHAQGLPRPRPSTRPGEKTATLVREYRHDGDLHAAYMGSFQRFGNGNVVVGWGAEPHISEYLEDGRVLLDGASRRPTSPIVRSSSLGWYPTATAGSRRAQRRGQ